MKTISKWAGSKFGFYVDRHYGDGKWVLKPGPIKLAEYHARILDHIFTPGSDGRLPYDTVGWCEPAKSGKSAIAGLVSEYVALHGESNSQIVMASNKQKQAQSLMFKSLTDSIEFNPYLPNIEPGKLSVTFRNGNEVKAIPSNSRGEAGARFSLALFDELWAYIYQDSERLWTEFKSDPTRQMSMKFAIGYAGYIGEGELWHNLLKRGQRGEPVKALADIVNEDGEPCCWRNGRTFVFWSHVCRQPWQTAEWIAEQADDLRAAEFLRMIKTIFAEGVGNFCEPDDWQDLIDKDHTPLPPGNPQPIYVGLDIATSPGGDDCALIGVYSDQGRVKVAFHKVWKGKDRKRIKGAREGQDRLKLKSTVFPYLIEKNEQYSLQGVWFDVYQALSLAEDLREEGITCIEVPQTHASRGPKDTALSEMVDNKTLVLYDNDDLKKAPNGADAKELGNNQIFIKKASRKKIDLLIALSNVADEALYASPPGQTQSQVVSSSELLASL